MDPILTPLLVGAGTIAVQAVGAVIAGKTLSEHRKSRKEKMSSGQGHQEPQQSAAPIQQTFIFQQFPPQASPYSCPVPTQHAQPLLMPCYDPQNPPPPSPSFGSSSPPQHAQPMMIAYQPSQSPPPYIPETPTATTPAVKSSKSRKFW